MSDIEKSFTFLHDSLPQWLDDLAGLENKVAAMHESVAKIPIAVSPFAKPTTGSVESTKHAGLAAIAEEAAPPQAPQTDPLPTRKRKTLSVLSGRASAPARYRRAVAVVEYDGDMQKSFELLVRAIGTGRNMLRKAKMEAKMNELAALAGASEDEDAADEDDNDAILAKISYRPRMMSMRTRAAAGIAARNGIGGNAVTSVALFDTTDKTLEHAQALCEKAAHAVLRDGDCRTELAGMRKSFTDVMKTAKIEVTRSTATKASKPQRTPSQDTSNTSLSSLEPSYKKHFPQLSQPPRQLLLTKSMLSTIPITTPYAPLKTMEIEVDEEEDDEDDNEFVMPYRFVSGVAMLRLPSEPRSGPHASFAGVM
ncbi:hypothetical protein BDU57DRAFT_554844 [Ampelomyces quisqualis]|uniref:Uncharacterized protein n=1 Tax=Ampelomyces quisqualis TaxID=50730 RepID=A0A6A5QVX8_AMPQU|nr:hypothetical protein BDU57DRAFT_554844 [Ampelomyces quisqualis]